MSNVLLKIPTILISAIIISTCSSSSNREPTKFDLLEEKQIKSVVAEFMKHCWTTLDNHVEAAPRLLADGYEGSNSKKVARQIYKKGEVTVGLWSPSTDGKKRHACSTRSRLGDQEKIMMSLQKELNQRNENYKLGTNGEALSARFPDRLKRITVSKGHISVRDCKLQGSVFFACF